MTFDEAVAEMKRHADAKRNQEEYLNKLNEATIGIKNVATKNEIKSWQLVELLIQSKAKILDTNEDHIRDLLKGD